MSDLPPLRHPYRAVALLHAGLAAVILVFAGVTGGDLTRALGFAAAYFAIATGWSWLRFRQRDRRAARGGAQLSERGEKTPGRNGDS